MKYSLYWDYGTETIQYPLFFEKLRKSKPFIALEHCMKPPHTFRYSKDYNIIHADNIAMMNYDYFQSLKYEIVNLEEAEIIIPIKPTRSCKDGVIENGLFTETPMKLEVIQTSECLSHETHDDGLKQISFDLRRVKKAAGQDYHLWLENIITEKEECFPL